MKFIISLLVSIFIHYTTFSFESNTLNIPDSSSIKKDWYFAGGIEGGLILNHFLFSPSLFGVNIEYTNESHSLSVRAKKFTTKVLQINSFFYGLQYTHALTKGSNYGIGLAAYNFHDYNNYYVLTLELNRKYVWEHNQIKLFLALNRLQFNDLPASFFGGVKPDGDINRVDYKLEFGLQLQLKY